MSLPARSKLCTKDTVKAEGLNIWVDGSADGQSAKLDIILVQGLGSHPYYTWTGQGHVSKRTSSRLTLAGLNISSRFRNQSQKVNMTIPEVFWPRDLLPQHLPPSRIATYSYRSEWRSGDFKATLRECGNQLLNILHQHRREKSILKRPIIFIGHSLGGLVIQQALVIADHGTTFEDIRRSTSGAIFLGVPQQGSDYAGFADLLTRACRNDQPLLRNLKAHNLDLLSLARDFWSEYGRLPVVCFYEKNDAKLGPINFKMVNSQSASVPEKRMIYLSTDHSGLNKFRDEDDENFQLLRTELKEIAKDAVSQHHEVLAMKRPIMIPFPRDRDFVKREGYMSQVATALGDVQSSARVALVGLGGVGKSQIAIEYAYRVRMYDPEISIFWVHASSPARFLSSYRSIAIELKLPRVDDPNANILDMVHTWLSSESSGRWLILLDNADDASFVHADYENEDPPQYQWTITKYLPHRDGGAVVVTTRSSDAAFGLVGREDLVVKVEPMSHDESRLLLRTKLSTRHANEDDENALIKELDNIPLAITQAAAFLSKSQRMTISKYLDRLRSDEKTGASLLSTGGGDLRRDPEATNSVIRTWQISFNQIKSENQLAADLLSRMCMFDKQGIPESLLKENVNDLDYDDAIEVLLSFSFVRAETETRFEIHRLVQLATRTWLRVHGDFESQSEAALKILSEKYPGNQYENWTTCQVLEPHAEAILSISYTSVEARLSCAGLLMSRAWYLADQGGYTKAEAMAKQSLSLREELLGKEDPRTAMSMASLGYAYDNLGRYSEAETLRVQALEVSKRLHGDEHVRTLHRMSELASTYREQARWEEAETLYLKVLDVRRRLYEEEHKDTLTSMGELARLYIQQERWLEAGELLVQVLERRKRVLGETHPHTVTTMANLAVTLKNGRQRRWEEAEEMEVKALEIMKRVNGEEHPSTVQAMANLAVTLKKGGQGRWEEVEELELQVLEIRKRVNGQEHPHTVQAMANLAVTLKNRGQGRWEEAEELEVKVLEISKRVKGEEHPSTVQAMANLAVTLKKGGQGRWEEVEELELQVLEIRKRVLGQEHRKTLDAMDNLAFTYCNQGRWDEAEELEVKLFEIRKRVNGEEHPYTVQAMDDLASTYYKQGHLPKAIAMLTQACQHAENVRGTNGVERPKLARWTATLEDWKLEDIAQRVWECGKQRLWGEAEELSTEALEMSKTIRGEAHPHTITCTSNLAYCYYKQGRFSAAIELMTKAVHDAEVTTPDEKDYDMTRWTDVREIFRESLEQWKSEAENPKHCSEQHSTTDGSPLQDSKEHDWITADEAEHGLEVDDDGEAEKDGDVDEEVKIQGYVEEG